MGKGNLGNIGAGFFMRLLKKLALLKDSRVV
jgi:hypothetical protein